MDSHSDHPSSNGSDNGSANGISYEPFMFRSDDDVLNDGASVSVSFYGESSRVTQIDTDGDDLTEFSNQLAGKNQTDDEILQELREILVSPEQSQIEVLSEDVATLNKLIDERHLLERMTPLVHRVIERQIREAPQEVIELLYPLLGGMVARSVKEAVRNLADRIDAQRKQAFNFQRIFSKVRATSRGVSGSAVDFRDALPFSVEELFIIHSDSGLLIHHESCHPEESTDSDIIGSMLTAISDFVQDSFGQGLEGNLDEIEYGGMRILLERFQHVYVAAVVDGIESYDYRHEIRRRVGAFERENRQELVDYAGDTSRLDIRTDSLRKLLFVE